MVGERWTRRLVCARSRGPAARDEAAFLSVGNERTRPRALQRKHLLEVRAQVRLALASVTARGSERDIEVGVPSESTHM
jgi:hypothetical protein